MMGGGQPMKNFAMTGVAGYVAPRHLKAIRDTGNRLRVAVDPHDSVGVLDGFFPDVSYFREFERFDRHVERLRRGDPNERIDYVTVCSPNYLHDAHVRLALRVGADAICEKPLVLNPWNLDALQELERETGRRVYTILQLRLHPALMALHAATEQEPPGTRHDVSLTYITPRGPWYQHSWKGDLDKSGGIATNIGIHFFDLLLWVFGKVRQSALHLVDRDKAAGILELERADVRWFLSIDRGDLPPDVVKRGRPSFRLLEIDGREVEFSEGFTDLHTRVYESILAGHGFGIDESRPAIQLVHDLREKVPSGVTDALHSRLSHRADTP